MEPMGYYYGYYQYPFVVQQQPQQQPLFQPPIIQMFQPTLQEQPTPVELGNPIQDFQTLLDHYNQVVFSALDAFTMKSSQELLARPYATIAEENLCLEEAKSCLLQRMNANYPGERCLLLALINAATVCVYQNGVIIQAKRRCRDNFFNWAASYRDAINTGQQPCRLVVIPDIGFEFDFMFSWLAPRDYRFMHEYFYYHLLHCDSPDCCGPLE